MHVATTRRQYKGKVYETHLLRRSYREDGKVKNETLANLSYLPAETIQLIRESLAGKRHVAVDEGFELTHAPRHGHLAAASLMANQLDLPSLLGPACDERTIVYALILARVVRPKPSLSSTKWWTNTTLATDFDIEGIGADRAAAAIDWLGERQGAIEATLASRHLGTPTDPAPFAYFDLATSLVKAKKNRKVTRDRSAVSERDVTPIKYGVLRDRDGRPIAVELLTDGLENPDGFIGVVESVRNRFAVARLTVVGEHEQMTGARRTVHDGRATIGWLTCLRGYQITALADHDRSWFLSLESGTDLVEFTDPHYPNERLVALRNPSLAPERARMRNALLDATEDALEPLLAAVSSGRLRGTDTIEAAVGAVLNEFESAKYFEASITEATLRVVRRDESIAAAAAVDGIEVLRSTIGGDETDALSVVRAYRDRARAERDFRHLKLNRDSRSSVHRGLEDRARSHLFVALLAAYIEWHLRAALAPLTDTDVGVPTRNPAADPQGRSRSTAKSGVGTGAAATEEVLGFRELLDHLGTLTRNFMVATEAAKPFELLATPTAIQRRAFELLGAPVPRRLIP